MADALTFGCRLNAVESAALAGMAVHLVDTVVVDTCAVTLTAEQEARQAIARVHRGRPGAALAAVERARWVRPDVGIGADLIAVFPTETEALFAETLAFVDEAVLPWVHVFPYSARPGTPAARMPQVATSVRRERAARLRAAALPHAGAFHAGLVGTEAAIVVERGRQGDTAEGAAVRLREAGDIGCLGRRTVLAADAAGVEA